MTTDYIHIDDLISAFNEADGDICDFCGGSDTCSGFAGEYGFSPEKIMEVIGNAHTASLDELIDYCKLSGRALIDELGNPCQRNMHGEWVNDGCGYRCSVCGKAAPYYTENNMVVYWPDLNFCYNCGADMTGNLRGNLVGDLRGDTDEK